MLVLREVDEVGRGPSAPGQRSRSGGLDAFSEAAVHGAVDQIRIEPHSVQQKRRRNGRCVIAFDNSGEEEAVSPA